MELLFGNDRLERIDFCCDRVSKYLLNGTIEIKYNAGAMVVSTQSSKEIKSVCFSNCPCCGAEIIKRNNKKQS